MHLIIAGPKGAGKSTVGRRVADELGWAFIETDTLIEDGAQAENPHAPRRDCRALLREEGEAAFRRRERRAAFAAAGHPRPAVISTGGQTLLDPESRRELRAAGLVAWLDAPADFLWERVRRGGVPAYLKSADPRAEFAARLERLVEAARPVADFVVPVDGRAPDGADGDGDGAGVEPSPGSIARATLNAASREMAVRMRAANNFGEVLRLATFGESHGPAIGAVLDGMPAGEAFDAARVQQALDRRRPGQSAVSTARAEADRVRVLSGVFEGKTLGTPIAFLIENSDPHSSDYDALREVFRPGHADFGFFAKFGRRDHRGGGRSSGRETAARVAGGAAALCALEARGVRVRAWAEEIAGVRAEAFDPGAVENNPVRCPDPLAAERMTAAILAARDAGDSVGGVIVLEATGVPPGWGDPVFGKLDARLAGAMMSLGGVKGVEIGDGFAAARARGSENNDPLRPGPEGDPLRPVFESNHAGGILGGISTGQTIRLRLAVKPTPSVRGQQQTINRRGEAAGVSVGGRHDPCIVPRLVPVVEAMAGLVLLDAALVQERLSDGGAD